MLAEKLSQYFRPPVRARGRSCFGAGHVEMLTIEPSGQVVATVVGGDFHDVELEVVQRPGSWFIEAWCSCPYHDQRGDFCKHLWATILAVDCDGRLGLPQKSVYLAWNDDAYYGDLRESLRGIDDLTHGKGFNDRRPGRKDTRPPWLRLMDELAVRSSPASPPNRFVLPPLEPFYILEAHESEERGCLTVSLAHREMTSTGKLGKVKKLTLRPDDMPRLSSPLDREICLMLVGARPADDQNAYGFTYAYQSYRGYGSSYIPGQSTWEVPSEIHATLLPLLFRTGRFRLRAEPGGEPTDLGWADGPDWELVLAVERNGTGKQHCLCAFLQRDGERCDLDQIECVIPGDPGLVVRRGVVEHARLHECGDWIRVLQERGPVPVTKSTRQKLLTQLANLAVCPPVTWPADWDITRITDLAPAPELSLLFETGGGTGRSTLIEGRVVFHYETMTTQPGDMRSVLFDPSHKRQIHRRLDVEKRRMSRLSELGLVPAGDSTVKLPVNRMPEAVGTLLNEGWTVLGDRKLFRKSGAINIKVASGIDWFDLEGEIDFDGQAASLTDLLEAARKGSQFVQLGDGSMGMLPEAWLARFEHFFDLGNVEADHVRFAKTQVGLIDALLNEMPDADIDANVASARRKLAEFQGIEKRTACEAFVGTLRPYQEDALGWLAFLDTFEWGGCLADDMGLGKTVQMLAHLCDRHRPGSGGPSLLVMPKSIVFNWQREAQRFAPNLRLLNYTGTGRKALREQIADSDLVLTTYGTFKRDIEHLRQHQFDYVILDEAQAIKNPASQNAKAARLLPGRRRIAMTGTPVENHLGDLWSLFEFLNPGMLGNLKAFGRAFGNCTPEHPGTEELKLLQRMVRPFILRRTKEQVAPELPVRSEQVIECTMPAKQASYYRKLRDACRMSLLKRVDDMGLARSKVHVLEALLRLRQAACHPGMIDPAKRDDDAAKLEVLMPQLTELIEEGHKALIFSQFTKMLAILRSRLDKTGVDYCYLDGRTRKRNEQVDRFQSDASCPLFLISLKAGGTGLNLTAADYVFLLDPWWNPAVEAQAIDRAHRIGQDKKVIAYRLITCDTVESKILELQQSKRDLAGAIVTDTNSVIRNLTRDDLMTLLS